MTTPFTNFSGSTSGGLIVQGVDVRNFSVSGELIDSDIVEFEWGTIEYGVGTEQVFSPGAIAADAGFSLTVNIISPPTQGLSVTLSIESRTSAVQGGQIYIHDIAAGVGGTVCPGVELIYGFATHAGEGNCTGAPLDFFNSQFENKSDSPQQFNDGYVRDDFIYQCNSIVGHCNSLQHSITLVFPPNFVGKTDITSNSFGIGQSSGLAVIPGDVNQDGQVNLLDVQPFIEAVSSGGINPWADINSDGAVDLLDVAPFVDLLTGDVPTTEIVAHFKFDELPGETSALDSIGSITGSLFGTSSDFVTDGISGNALTLSEVNGDHVSMGDEFGFSGNSPYSLSFWVKTNDSEDGTIVVGKHVSGTPNGYFVGLDRSGSGAFGSPNKAYLVNSGPAGSEVVSNTDVTDGAWHHIVAVFNGTDASIYVDGAPAEDGPNSASPTSNLGDFILGGFSLEEGGVSPTYTGLVDDLQIYDGPLDNEEIEFLFNNPGVSTDGG